MSSKEFLVKVTAIGRVRVESETVTPSAEAVHAALEDDLTIGMSREPFYDHTAGGYVEFIDGQEASRLIEVEESSTSKGRTRRSPRSKPRPRKNKTSA